MINWKVLEKNEYTQLWNLIYNDFIFSPYSSKKLIELPYPHIIYNISSHYDEGYSEIFYKNLHKYAVNYFKKISNGGRIYALNWQHDCYSFDPYLPFEKDEFDEWLIPVFPNGDYLFFINNDLQEGVFCDGINLELSFFGQQSVEILEHENPIL
ncbi:MAG: DUF2716 domain-containing protein [Bacteroidetes bacterium]|nr:DUF2716 domain-containing protein [Bacteroidota bacterium]